MISPTTSFEDFFNKYRKVLDFLVSDIKTQDKEDIYNELVIVLHKIFNYCRNNYVEKEYGFIHQSLMNEKIRIINKNRSMKKNICSFNTLITDDLELIDTIETSENLPQKYTVEEIYQVAKLIMTNKEYRIFILHFKFSYKNIEIASILKVTQQNISLLLKRAIKRIKDYYFEYKL